MDSIIKSVTACMKPTVNLLLPIWLITKLLVLYRLRRDKSENFSNLIKRKEES